MSLNLCLLDDDGGKGLQLTLKSYYFSSRVQIWFLITFYFNGWSEPLIQGNNNDEENNGQCNNKCPYWDCNCIPRILIPSWRGRMQLGIVENNLLRLTIRNCFHLWFVSHSNLKIIKFIKYANTWYMYRSSKGKAKYSTASNDKILKNTLDLFIIGLFCSVSNTSYSFADTYQVSICSNEQRQQPITQKILLSNPWSWKRNWKISYLYWWEIMFIIQSNICKFKVSIH